MSSFTEQVPLDPDDPELHYTPLRLSERAAKLGPSVSQGARSEPIRSSQSPVPPRSIPRRLTNMLGIRVTWIGEPHCQALPLASLRSLRRGGRGAAVRHHEACLTAIGRRFNPFRHDGSTSTAPPQSSQADVEWKPALAEFKALLASPPSQPATREQSSSCFRTFCNGVKKPAQPKHLNSGPTDFVGG